MPEKQTVAAVAATTSSNLLEVIYIPCLIAWNRSMFASRKKSNGINRKVASVNVMNLKTPMRNKKHQRHWHGTRNIQQWVDQLSPNDISEGEPEELKPLDEEDFNI
jgi:hypothetical protein